MRRRSLQVHGVNVLGTHRRRPSLKTMSICADVFGALWAGGTLAFHVAFPELAEVLAFGRTTPTMSGGLGARRFVVRAGTEEDS